VEAARQVIGTEKWVGVSTHNLEQFGRAAAASADYIAVGPVFFTSTKTNPDPVIASISFGVFVCSQTNRLWPLGHYS